MILGATVIPDTRLQGSGMVGIVAGAYQCSRRLNASILGIPKIFSPSKTLKTEVVESEPDRIIFKLQQQYTPKVIKLTKVVNSLVTLSLDDQGKVKYHKDMWNEKDYSHEGLGKVMKTLNGDQLTKVSQDSQLCFFSLSFGNFAPSEHATK